MPNERDRLSAAPTDDSSSWMASLLAEEDSFDRRMLWRLGTWAGCAVGLLTVAVLASQSSNVLRRERTAYAEMSRQAQQIQSVAKENQDEARRLAAAVDTLNGDRDRLYSRVTVLEQGLDSVTGSISKQASAPPLPQTSPPASPPSIAAPVTVTDPAASLEKKTDIKPEQKSDSAAIPLTLPPAKPVQSKPQAKTDAPDDSKPAHESELKQVPGDKKDTALVTSSVTALPDSRETTASQSVQRTDFGIDIGTANSVEGLRALWRGLLTTQGQILGGLQPIIVVKERTDGFGMQLRLVAGPIANAAEAAKVCARLIANKRLCETSVFDGQRLAMNETSSRHTPATASPKQSRRSRARVEEPPSVQRGFTSIFGR